MLSVWLDAYDAPIGTLGDDATGLPTFQYAPGYLDRSDVIPLSLALPLGAAPFSATSTRAFFENLLQENDYLSRQLADANVDRKDLVGVLSLVGKDCAGAVACTPAGDAKPKHPGDLVRDYAPIEDIEKIVASLARKRPATPGKHDQSPIAGVQPKIALTIVDGRYFQPLGGAPSTHILKVAPDDAPLLADNEYACLSLVRALGCRTVVAERRVIEGRGCLLISRYDRVRTDTQVFRLHQEDFAQAIGLQAAQKYERGEGEGRYSQAAIWSVIDRTLKPSEDRLNFLRLTLANLIIANSDNHAKNHALVYAAGRYPELTPAYDLVCTPIDPSNSLEFAFRLGGAKNFEELKGEDLVAFAEGFAGSPVRARRACQTILKGFRQIGLEAAMDQAAEGIDATLAQELRDVWRERFARLIEMEQRL